MKLWESNVANCYAEIIGLYENQNCVTNIIPFLKLQADEMAA